MYLIKKIVHFIGFVLFFLRKLIEANFFIARDLLTPGLKVHPGYVKVKITLNSDFQILLLSNLVSMTPGSLVVDVSHDRHELLVHSLYAADQQKVMDEVDEFQLKIQMLFK